MKKTFIAVVCVLAFTNFLFLTLAPTNLLFAAGCGITTGATCSFGSFRICRVVIENPCSRCFAGGAANDGQGCWALAMCENPFQIVVDVRPCPSGGPGA